MNGSKWAIQRTATLPGVTDAILWAVACSSVTTCTAVGEASTDNTALMPLVERRLHARWSIQPTPTIPGAQGVLSGVSCSSPTACTAVGQASVSALAERWNGHRWSLQRLPKPAFPSFGLYGVSCVSAIACVAVRADALTESWNGRTWTIHRAQNAGPPGERTDNALTTATVSSSPCSSTPTCPRSQSRNDQWTPASVSETIREQRTFRVLAPSLAAISPGCGRLPSLMRRSVANPSTARSARRSPVDAA